MSKNSTITFTAIGYISIDALVENLFDKEGRVPVYSADRQTNFFWGG